VIEAISGANEAPALAYLARAPYLNVFLSHMLLHDPAPETRRKLAVARDGDAIAGVGYWGRQVVLAAEPSALAEFADYARRHRGERMIVAPRETVAAYWDLVRAWHVPPRLVRDRQLVMAVDRRHLRRDGPPVLVRHAHIDEWNEVADGSAEMIRHELSYDPRRNAPEFGLGIRRMIERKLWWVGERDGRLCFYCNVGPWSPQTAQLQGIWTPPELRGQGLATASLAAICDRLLEISPTLSLYVNDFNEPAIALYRRVGFHHTGDFQTLLF
jgi:uncharacterized protein